MRLMIGNRPATEREKHIQKLFDSTPRLAEWVNSLPQNEQSHAIDCIEMVFCIMPDEVISAIKEGREKRRRNRPHAVKMLKHLEAAQAEAVQLDNTAAGYLTGEINRLRSEIQRTFIDKNGRNQKSGWEDYARFSFGQLFDSIENRSASFSKPLELREVDYFLIIQSAIGEHVSRDAVKNWIKRENMPLGK